MEDVNLIYLGFQGACFTWRRVTLHQLLDIYVGNKAWFNSWADSSVLHLARIGFDHRPVLLSGSARQPTQPQRPSNTLHHGRMIRERFLVILGKGRQDYWNINRVLRRLENGKWINDMILNRDGILKIFKKLFAASQGSLASWTIRDRFRHLFGVENDALNITVTDDEVYKAIFNMNSLKSPRIDAIQVMFFQKKWDVMGRSVVAFMRGCFDMHKVVLHWQNQCCKQSQAILCKHCGFLKGSSTYHKGISFVRWKDVQAPLETYGLGFRDMERFNQACLMKFGFQLATDEEILWVKVVQLKHRWEGVLPKSLNSPNGSRVWSEICHVWRMLETIWVGMCMMGVWWTSGLIIGW
ncbi:hypothetical protein GQ457_09G019510 [Hibiscus cannabinus]